MSAVLTITKLGNDAIRFTFESRKRKPFAAPIQEVWEVPVERDALLAFCQAISDAAVEANITPSGGEASIKAFERAGKGLFCELFPKTDARVRELLAKLRGLKTPLLISTDEPNFFWELLFDDELKAFFGMKYRLGRRLMTREVPAGMLRDRKEWSCLMIADPTGNLPQTAREAAQLRDWIESRNFKQVDYLTAEKANFNAVLSALSSKPYDIIHYAGHTVLEPESNEYALELHDRHPFRASLIRKHLTGNPIVFLNGCWSGLAKGVANSPGSVEGLTDAFLAAGAQVVVGSQFQVPDAGARAFAERFYQSLLDGICIGEAMQNARRSVMSAPDCGAAWACFVLYGDPAVQLNLKNDSLGKLLASINLKRENFDQTSLRIVEQALNYSGKSGLVATIELFASLVDKEASMVRSNLEQQGVHVEKLADAFRSALKQVNETPIKGKKKNEPVFSTNAAAMLQNAALVIQSGRNIRITEHDLVNAFIKLNGGNTKKILDSIGVDLQRLAPQKKRPPDAGKVSPPLKTRAESEPGNPPALSLTTSMFTTKAWGCILSAIREAMSGKLNLLGTPQLFIGLQHRKDSILARALHRLNLSTQTAKKEILLNGESQMPSVAAIDHESIAISKNARAVIESARRSAEQQGRKRITERDILKALVSSGGSVMKFLASELNLVPEALASELFLPSNEFDLSKFAESLHTTIRTARMATAGIENSLLGRRHFLAAMVADPCSLLWRQAIQLGDGTPPTGIPDDPGVAKRTATPIDLPVCGVFISIDLANALAEAELDARNRHHEIISEAGFLLYLLRRSGDFAETVSSKLNTNWPDLIASVQKRLDES